METRKVQLSGGTTYTISLPKSWAKEHGIESGSLLELHPNDDGSLLIEVTADRTSGERTATLDISKDSDRIVRQRIHAAHTIGIDSVTLFDPTGHPDNRRQLIERTIQGLSGLEILEISENRIRLTNLIDAENVDVRKSTLRLRLVMLAMHRDAVTALVEDDAELARRVIERDNEADKLFAMITRHFRRSLTDLHEVEKLEQSRDGLFECYYTARQFERIADHAEKMAEFVLEPDVAFPEAYAEEFTELGSAVRQVVDHAADGILTDTGIETVSAVFKKHVELRDRLEELDRELYEHDVPGEAYLLGLLLDSLRRTAEYGTNVAEVAMQQITRKRAA